MNRIINRIVLVLLIGLPVGDLLWGVWASHRLSQTLAALHAAGEPVTPGQLKLDSIPDAQNASMNYRAAADSIDSSTAAWKTFWDANSRQFKLPLTDSEIKTIHSIVQANATALDQVTAARGKPAGGWDDPFNHPSALAIGDLNGVRKLCNLLKLAAMQAHVQGNDQLSVQRLSDALSEADASEHRPTLISHLVAVGATAFACEAVSEMAPQLRAGSNGLSRSQLSQLLAQLQDERAINDGATLSWRSERMVGITGLTDLVAGSFPSPPNGTLAPPSIGSRVFGWMAKPILLNDARLYADYVQGMIAASAAPDWPAAHSRLPTALPALLQSHPIYHLFIGLLLPSLDKAAKVDYDLKAARRLATVALAARLYAADHNDQLPTALEELIPAYLPVIPIDPMSGSPLKYKSDPPRVYSIGDDGVDDGGIPVDPEGDRFRRMHGDLVVYLATQTRK
jgi:hypothetical protein